MQRLYGEAKQLMAAEDFPAAVAKFDETLAVDPHHADAFFMQGMAYLRMGEHEHAETAFTGAVVHDPDNPSARNNRGIVRKALGKLDLALVDADDAIEIDPDRAAFHLNRADTLAKLRRHEEALSAFLRARELEPGNPFVEQQIAWLYATSPDESIRDGSKAVQWANQAGDLCNWRLNIINSTMAAAHAANGELEQAVEWETMARAEYSDAELQAWGDRLAKYQAGEELYDPET